MGRKIRMVCTVGTSLSSPIATEEDFYRVTESDEAIFDHVCSLSVPPFKKMVREAAIELMKNVSADPELYRKEVINRTQAVKAGSVDDYYFPGAEVQTIFRWLLDLQFLQSDEERRADSLHVILLPSDDIKSKMTAQSASVILNRLSCLFTGTDIRCDRVQDIKSVPIRVGTREEFLSSIANLFRAFDVERKDTPEDTELIICASGGYKSVSGFAMMYAQIHSLPCLYTFESSSDAFEVMSVPLGYAYASLDEEISMLRAIKEMEKSGDSSVGRLVQSDALPRWVRDSRELADTLISSYKAAREKPFGIGIELFNRLRAGGGEGKEWADYIEYLLVHNWAHLWLGDQIPETVEHSRRHSKRLMEFTANLFRAAGGHMEKLGFTNDNPQMLALLIAAIYLHDIGHTAIEAEGFPLGLFPSAVRDLHHLLTGRLLRNDPDRYFRRREPKNGDDARAEFLSRFVPLLAEHHRGYTALEGKNADGEKVKPAGELLLGREYFDTTLHPLSKRCEDKLNTRISITKAQLLNAAALMRVIDGCDVQSDRVVSQDYLEYHRRRTDEEIGLLRREFVSLQGYVGCELRSMMERMKERGASEKDVYKQIFAELCGLKNTHGSWSEAQREEPGRFIALSLADRIAFKSVQQEHFRKHNSVSFVLPVANGDNVSVKLFPANDADMKSVEKIKEDISGEYKNVENVLAGLKFEADIVSATETAKEPKNEGK